MGDGGTGSVAGEGDMGDGGTGTGAGGAALTDPGATASLPGAAAGFEATPALTTQPAVRRETTTMKILYGFIRDGLSMSFEICLFITISKTGLLQPAEPFFLPFLTVAQRLLDFQDVERQDEKEGKLSSVRRATGS